MMDSLLNVQEEQSLLNFVLHLILICSKKIELLANVQFIAKNSLVSIRSAKNTNSEDISKVQQFRCPRSKHKICIQKANLMKTPFILQGREDIPVFLL